MISADFSALVTSRASGMSVARIRPFATGTIGSSVPAITSVGCESKVSQGRLLQPTPAGGALAQQFAFQQAKRCRPEKSIIRFALDGDLQTFAISWKNPTAAESRFGLDTYVAAMQHAVDVSRAVARSADVNIWVSCSGGIVTSAFLANLAARGEAKFHSATVAVCVLDMAVAQNTTAGVFVTPESIVAAKSASRLAGVVEGQEMARMFAWMRPNDLIWNYWVNNYLLGNAPPAFDVLYWNN